MTAQQHSPAKNLQQVLARNLNGDRRHRPYNARNARYYREMSLGVDHRIAWEPYVPPSQVTPSHRLSPPTTSQTVQHRDDSQSLGLFDSRRQISPTSRHAQDGKPGDGLAAVSQPISLANIDVTGVRDFSTPLNLGCSPNRRSLFHTMAARTPELHKNDRPVLRLPRMPAPHDYSESFRVKQKGMSEMVQRVNLQLIRQDLTEQMKQKEKDWKKKKTKAHTRVERSSSEDEASSRSAEGSQEDPAERRRRTWSVWPEVAAYAEQQTAKEQTSYSPDGLDHLRVPAHDAAFPKTEELVKRLFPEKTEVVKKLLLILHSDDGHDLKRKAKCMQDLAEPFLFQQRDAEKGPPSQHHLLQKIKEAIKELAQNDQYAEQLCYNLDEELEDVSSSKLSKLHDMI